jgi:hypothetical protein
VRVGASVGAVSWWLLGPWQGSNPGALPCPVQQRLTQSLEASLPAKRWDQGTKRRFGSFESFAPDGLTLSPSDALPVPQSHGLSLKANTAVPLICFRVSSAAVLTASLPCPWSMPAWRSMEKHGASMEQAWSKHGETIPKAWRSGKAAAENPRVR